MFKNKSALVRKRFFRVHKDVIKGCFIFNIFWRQIHNIVTNRIVTDFLVLPVNIRYNYVPILRLTNMC
jgi:hypothetical protein